MELAVEQKFQDGIQSIISQNIPKCRSYLQSIMLTWTCCAICMWRFLKASLYFDEVAVWFTVINTHILAFRQRSCVLLKTPKSQQKVTSTCRALNLSESSTGCLCSTGRFFLNGSMKWYLPLLCHLICLTTHGSLSACHCVCARQLVPEGNALQAADLVLFTSPCLQNLWCKRPRAKEKN